jgi:hypothetical protein
MGPEEFFESLPSLDQFISCTGCAFGIDGVVEPLGRQLQYFQAPLIAQCPHHAVAEAQDAFHDLSVAQAQIQVRPPMPGRCIPNERDVGSPVMFEQRFEQSLINPSHPV